MHKSSDFSIFLPALVISCFFLYNPYQYMRSSISLVFFAFLQFLVIDYLFMCILLVFSVSSLEKCLFKSFAQFWNGFFFLFFFWFWPTHLSHQKLHISNVVPSSLSWLRLESTRGRASMLVHSCWVVPFPAAYQGMVVLLLYCNE